LGARGKGRRRGLERRVMTVAESWLCGRWHMVALAELGLGALGGGRGFVADGYRGAQGE
jgi:hypothetical protein